MTWAAQRAIACGDLTVVMGPLDRLGKWLALEIDWTWNVRLRERGSAMADAFTTAIEGASTTVLGYIGTALPLVLGVAVAWLGIKVGKKAIGKMA